MENNMSENFEATFASLRKYTCPDWFRDAKFGIWSHWGPQSVPMDSDWYARNMYIQGTSQYEYHLRHYGHPSKFGYVDICKSWKAENFHPEELIELYYHAGARYFMTQATHHDNFFNYASKINPFNAVNIGPQKDICLLWKKACAKYDLPFAVSEHLAASFNWFYPSKGHDSYGPFKDIPYDGGRPAYQQLYHDNTCESDFMRQNGNWGEMSPEWMTANTAFHEYWTKAVCEMIDYLSPDLLYSDSALPFKREHDDQTNYQPGLEAVAHLYNNSIKKYGTNRAVYTQKDRNPEIYRIGILDVERSQLPDIPEAPWQTDTCIGNWFYDSQVVYKKPAQVIEMLIDIISKNGTLMLNIPQLPDGSIDVEARFTLEELGKWFHICSESVYGTRPFRIFGEGDTRVTINGFTEDRTAWKDWDYRFTQKGKTLYAFVMKTPESHICTLRSLAENEMVKGVRLLGHGDIPFRQSFGVLNVKLPAQLPTEYVNCLAIELQ